MLTEFEREVMEKLLAGDHPVLAALRDQLRACEVRSRDLTGHGFLTDLHVDRSAPPVAVPGGRMHIGDVGAEIDEMMYGAGFILFVDGGYLDMLEGFSYEEPWPCEIARYVLRYERGRERDPGAITAPAAPNGAGD
jgi:hypothetical protein